MAGPFNYDITFFQGEDYSHLFQQFIACDPAPPWTKNTPYVVGDYATPTGGGGGVFMAVVAGTANATTEPVWPLIKGGRIVDGTVTWMRVDATRLLDTTGYTAEWAVKASPTDVANLMSGTTANARAEVGYSPAKWAIGTVYVAGNQVVPTTLNGWVYQCETGGTSHATTEPVWTTTLGAVNASADNGVIWRNVRTDAYVSNLRVALTAAYTNSITDWAQGVWQFDLYDGFTRQPAYVGNAFFTVKGST